MRVVAGTILLFALASLLAAQQPASHSAAAGPATPVAAKTNSGPEQNSTPPANSSIPDPKSATTQAEPASAQPTNPPAPAEVILPTVSKREVAEAKRQFEAGVKLKKKGTLDEAFVKFSSASELDPRSYDYAAAREFTREELAMQALRKGNQAMLDNNEVVAMAEFQRALQYDPTNQYALQRLRDAMPEQAQPEQPMTVVEQSTPIELQPAAPHHDFHFRGDSRTLLMDITRAYGIDAEFDESFKQRRVHFDIDDVNFATALGAADDVTKSFWVALSPKQIYFLADTVENRRQFERFGLETFHLPDLNDQQLTEMTNSLRVLLNLRFISTDKAQSTISIRAELPVLQVAEQLIKSLTGGRPEVLLDMRVYAVSANFARSLGTALPTEFNLFNISPALIAGLGQNAQNLINQVIASGGINQANSTAISALLAQLSNSSSSSILSQPFATFGGGLTLFGLNAAGVGISPTFSLNSSDIRSLEHVTLRASHNDPAVMKIGERYPIINATYAPIYNSSSIAQVIGNQSYVAPFPSFNFEDLGVNLKATPWIHGSSNVSMKIELQIRALSGTVNNGIPIISNREYTGNITVKNGESSVVTGMIDMDDSRSITGYPFLGQVPVLSYGTTVHNKNIMQDELLVVITPHILREAEQKSFAVPLPESH